MGDFEAETLVFVESTLKYHPCCVEALSRFRESGSVTVLGGQYGWGGLLPKSNGGAQRLTQYGRQSYVERKSISELDCETHKSSRCESRV